MPRLIFGAEKKLEFDEDSCPIWIGASKRCNFQIPRHQGVAEEHLEIDYEEKDSRYVLYNRSASPVTTDGGDELLRGAKKKLGASHFFAFGEKAEEKMVIAYQDETKGNTEKIIIQHDPLKNEQEILVADFYGNVNTDRIEHYLVQFIGRYFKVVTASLVVREPGRWMVVANFFRGEKHKPSVTLLKRLAASGRPVKYNYNTEQDASVSLIANKVHQAFFFPLVVSGEVIGGLYLDTRLREEGQKEDLSDKDFFQIQYLLQSGVAALVKARQDRARVQYPIRDQLPRLPFNVVVSKAFRNVAFACRSYAREKVFFLAHADRHNTASMAKAYLDGLLVYEDLCQDDDPEDQDTVLMAVPDSIYRKFRIPACEVRVKKMRGRLQMYANRTESGIALYVEKASKSFYEVSQIDGVFDLEKGDRLVVRPDRTTEHPLLEIAP